MSRKKDKDRSEGEDSPEVLMRKKFLSKCKFRACGRMVMANAYWLKEDLDHYEGLDVRRRVQQAVRTSKQKKQMLSINDKALLNKAATDRTDFENKYLYRILGGLKCFKRYPTRVKRKLAALLYYKYYGPGRVIVRQHQEAHALYFIITGEIIISQMIWDDLDQREVSVNIGVIHPGDMFGEISLLHNIPRTATCITSGHCEMLALMKEDFENVLQVCVQKQWDEVQLAMSSFTYFDSFDEVSRREGCIVAKMKSYEINDILLGDGAGIQNFVYFMLSGQCQMIETIQVIETKRQERSYYTLFDPYVPEVEEDLDIEDKYFANFKKSADRSLSKVDEGSIYTSKVFRKFQQFEDVTSPDFYYKSGTGSPRSTRMSFYEEAGDKKRQSLYKNIRLYFMQVCRFNAGSSFGFGEEMRDRRIVALTPVTCMLMPKVWLLQRNTANIWTRIQHYLEKKIPSKAQLFEEFVNTKYWEEYRDQVVNDVVSRSNRSNDTSLHDVPYSIRMEELIK